jgi:spermidine synthase
MKTLPGKEIACLFDKQGPVRVFDDGNKRYLSFGSGDEQSCIVKATPAILQYDYNRTMALVLLLCEPQNIYIFGLGGGSMTHCLLEHYDDICITVLELREAVIEVAQKYFALPTDSRLQLINGDALLYLEQMPVGQCDVLFSDLFVAEGLEARQLTQQFIQGTANALTDNGWLVMNCLEEYRTNKVIETLIARYYNTIFESITDDGNWVIIASKDDISIDKKALFSRVKQLSAQLGFSLALHFKRMF